MSLSPTLPTLAFYRRDDCYLCDEARVDLQAVLEDRVKRGDPIARVREINLADQPHLETRYGALIPVIAVDGQELTLVMGRRVINLFLDRVLGRAA